MRRRRFAAWAVAALAFVGPACGPPKAPLEVGVREVPTDVVIGTREVAGAPETPTTTIMGATGGASGVTPTPTTGTIPVTAPGSAPSGPSPTTTTSAPARGAVPLAPDPPP